jgi:hypothetical protein
MILFKYFVCRILMGVSRSALMVFQRSQIGAAFVDRHRLGFAILGD